MATNGVEQLLRKEELRRMKEWMDDFLYKQETTPFLRELLKLTEEEEREDEFCKALEGIDKVTFTYVEPKPDLQTWLETTSSVGNVYRCLCANCTCSQAYCFGHRCQYCDFTVKEGNKFNELCYHINAQHEFEGKPRGDHPLKCFWYRCQQTFFSDSQRYDICRGIYYHSPLDVKAVMCIVGLFI